jgi:hypothetical protein
MRSMSKMSDLEGRYRPSYLQRRRFGVASIASGEANVVSATPAYLRSKSGSLNLLCFAERKIPRPSGLGIFLWRRRGDSNSRYRSPRTNDLANRPLQPLGYSSVRTVYDNSFTWRRGRDSNPRYRCRHDGFQDRYLQPLGHLSVTVTRLFYQRSDVPSRVWRAIMATKIRFAPALRSWRTHARMVAPVV